LGLLWLAFAAAMRLAPDPPWRAPRVVGKDHERKQVSDEQTKRALVPSNYPQLRWA
jgi:hypothetical protein